VIPDFDPATGALPTGDHRATLEEIEGRFGFTPRRRWLLKGLRAAVKAFWAAGVEDIFIDGSFAPRSSIQVMWTAIGSSQTPACMIASILIGSTSR
jgi:hypothetical protein